MFKRRGDVFLLNTRKLTYTSNVKAILTCSMSGSREGSFRLMLLVTTLGWVRLGDDAAGRLGLYASHVLVVTSVLIIGRTSRVVIVIRTITCHFTRSITKRLHEKPQ